MKWSCSYTVNPNDETMRVHNWLVEIMQLVLTGEGVL